MRRALVAILMLLGLAGATLLERSRVSDTVEGAQSSRPSNDQTPAGTGPARVLMNEILFQPDAGESPWVELINTGGAMARLDGLVLENQAGEQFPLPQRLTLPSLGVLLIRFDGQPRVEGAIVHSDRTGFVRAETGSIALTANGNVLDEAFWSTSGDGPTFNLGRGGFIPELSPGTTLGRPRSSVGSGTTAWTIFDPDQVTPGQPNPYPAVVGMMPLSGAVLRTTTPALTWYGLPSALRYRVQVAAESTFASTVFDRTVSASGSGVDPERVSTSALPIGEYFWRVQAVFAGNQPSPFSPISQFWIASAQAAHRGHWADGLVATLLAAERQPSKPALNPLNVPLIMQRKDSFLLALEGTFEEGPMAWDQPWTEGQGMYCGRASVAMVTAFYHGKLSQDRIGYEVHSRRASGPFLDIDVTSSLTWSELERAVTFALGSPGTQDTSWSRTNPGGGMPTPRQWQERYWAAHKAAIDQGTPVIATSTTHAFVVIGYGEDSRGKYLTINDPAFEQYDWVVASRPEVWTQRFGTTFHSPSLIMPLNAAGRSDEPAVSKDSDGDGLMDFDENRFGTNPGLKDGDGDGVDDKNEIRAWMFDKRHGYSGNRRSQRGSDLDGDRKRMEVDEDSDDAENKTCVDGLEDMNVNGHYDKELEESDNFDQRDDRCVTGLYEWGTDFSSVSSLSTSHVNGTNSASISLKPMEGGRLEGLAIFRFESRQEVRDANGCVSSNATVPLPFALKLTGEITAQTATVLQIAVRGVPTQSPPTTLHWSNSCSTPNEGSYAMPSQLANWPLPPPFKLENGVFDDSTERPIDGGRIWTKVHLEQKRR